jgi:hypothetical protein
MGLLATAWLKGNHRRLGRWHTHVRYELNDRPSKAAVLHVKNYFTLLNVISNSVEK